MKSNRNISVIKHMVEYCERIDETIKFFGDEYELFCDNNIYKDATALCILQMGELTGVLTDEFKGKHDNIPWRQIRALRNIVAHRYGTVDSELLWEIIKSDVPKLKEYCRIILSESSEAAENSGGNQ